MPSFDVSCEYDKHEVSNAVDQANREVATRFDFKGINASFTLEKDTIKLKAQAEFQLDQMRDILENKLVKRNVDLGHIDVGDVTEQYKSAEQTITMQQGISSEQAKKIVKLIKGQKIKVQVAIQGDEVRVTGKKRDELQSVIAFLKGEELELPLQFGNFRD